jgi:prepilin-type processing-associated H-X9-DG protein
MHLRRGTATIVDVIAVTMVLLALVVWTVAAVSRARSEGNFVACASNLKQIGQAILVYMQTTHQWPRTRHNPDQPAANWYTAPDATNPFADDGPAENDVTAAYYLLIRNGLAPQTFACPSSPFLMTTRPNWTTRSNFIERETSYSFANPYPTRAAVAKGSRLDLSITAEYAIAADINPGGSLLLTTSRDADARSMANAISPNHRRRNSTMMVLYGDGHVEPVQNPFVGVQRDNIFTYGGPMKDRGGLGIVGSPIDGNDSVLLPVASAAYWQPFIEEQRRQTTLKWTIIAVSTALLLGLAGLLHLGWRKWRTRLAS